MQRDIAHRIEKYIAKYMAILDVHGEPPIVKLRSNLGATWLGRSTWSSRTPHTTVMELQSSILNDDRTLERVIAHEMIHHRDALAISKSDMALLGIGIKPEAHGASFREGAARINAIMGSDFVTAVSDKEYKVTGPSKTFIVVITPLPDGRLGWTWAARLGPAAQAWVDELVRKGSRIVRTTDERWTRGIKIKRYGGHSVPKDTADADALRRMFSAAV